MKLTSIHLYTEKRRPPTAAPAAALQRGGGLIGDRHCTDPKKQISITGMDVLEWVQQHPSALCARKFSGNLALDRIMGYPVAVGSVLRIGEGLVRITDTHKRCFYEDCTLARSGGPCPLRGGLWFAEALNDAKIHAGDTVEILTQTEETEP